MAAYSTQSHHLLGRPPTPLQAFRLPTLHCGKAWSLYAHKQQNQTINSVGSAQSRARRDSSQALCRCISHCVPSTPLPPLGAHFNSRQTTLHHRIDLLPKKAPKTQEHQTHSLRRSVSLILYNACPSKGLPLTYCIIDAIDSPQFMSYKQFWRQRPSQFIIINVIIVLPLRNA